MKVIEAPPAPAPAAPPRRPRGLIVVTAVVLLLMAGGAIRLATKQEPVHHFSLESSAASTLAAKTAHVHLVINGTPDADPATVDGVTRLTLDGVVDLAADRGAADFTIDGGTGAPPRHGKVVWQRDDEWTRYEPVAGDSSVAAKGWTHSVRPADFFERVGLSLLGHDIPSAAPPIDPVAMLRGLRDLGVPMQGRGPEMVDGDDTIAHIATVVPDRFLESGDERLLAGSDPLGLLTLYVDDAEHIRRVEISPSMTATAGGGDFRLDLSNFGDHVTVVAPPQTG